MLTIRADATVRSTRFSSKPPRPNALCFVINRRGFLAAKFCGCRPDETPAPAEVVRGFALTSPVVGHSQGSFRRGINLCELEVCDARGFPGEPCRCPETGTRPSRVGLLPRTCGNLWRRISSESQIYPSLGPCGAPKIVTAARAQATFCFSQSGGSSARGCRSLEGIPRAPWQDFWSTRFRHNARPRTPTARVPKRSCRRPLAGAVGTPNVHPSPCLPAPNPCRYFPPAMSASGTSCRRRRILLSTRGRRWFCVEGPARPSVPRRRWLTRRRCCSSAAMLALFEQRQGRSLRGCTTQETGPSAAP